MLLDLSATFDTVDQVKLLEILKHELGIDGVQGWTGQEIWSRSVLCTILK